ncbi:DUF262 domain-containing protein [Streptomyces sp. NPDC048257]|uniref:GmrSD restriction endonuclease domain-containing protein n=1 Tax=Streptomyces sp. NPDC048257 TaxID=3365526 RepID=UPI003710648D
MSLDSPQLKKLLQDVASGALQLPDFQRKWKWDDERIKAIIATVTLDYPLGVVMALQTGDTTRFRARPLSGAEGCEGRTPDLLLLDGQQRLTSLFQALYRDEPVDTVDGRGNDMRAWYYIDIAKAVGSPADRDEAIISVPESRVLTTGSAQRISLDLSTTELECNAGMFPLNIVFDTDRTTAWQQAYVTSDAANWPRWSAFQGRVLNHVNSFVAPMINLPAATTMDAVCAVFERVNTGGVPLNVFELLTATFAGNQEHVSEFGDYYQLPTVWEAAKQRLSNRFPVFGSPEAGSDDGLSSSDFLQAVALLRTWELKQAGDAAAVSCKRRDLLNLPLADFRRLAPRITDAFEWVGEFLERQCIVRAGDLPYRSQLVPLAAVRAIVGEETDAAGGEERIDQWYWNGVLGEMYGQSTETRVSRDVEQLVAWIRREPSVVPETVTEAVFLDDRLDTLTTRNSAAYKGIYALLIKQGAVDWYFTEGPLKASQIIAQNVDVRLIFPKNWVAKTSGRHKMHATSIVNKTPLSLRAGRSMAGAPSSYLKTLQLESGLRSEWFDDVLATHLIDPALVHEPDFDQFYDNRAKQLLDLVQTAMGKRTVYRDAQGR